MSTISFLRQQDLVDGERLAKVPITVIGAGAIGSFTTLALAKMGARNITVYDFDTVEPHNLPNQFYRLKDLTRPKVDALSEIVRDYSGVEIRALNEKFLGQEVQGIVIVAVDSMSERARIMKVLKQAELLIDVRMGAEVCRIYSVHPLIDREFYKETMYADAIQEPCTRRSISYTALGASALVCGKVKKHIQGEPYKKEIIVDFKLGLLMAG
jgi:hypothetical protein